MSTPDQIRDDIERTRAELGGDVDALADKVRPSSIVQRQADKVRDAVGGVKDRLIGVASDISDGTANAGQTAVRKAQGHPIAVGLIAFGVGLLASSLLPASEKEKELAGSLKDAAEPLAADLADAAKESAANLKEPAQEALANVKDSAADAFESVKSEGKDAAATVAGGSTEDPDGVQQQPDTL